MDGSTLGAAIALMKKNKPTDAQVESAVSNWLDDHPEATTTVQDGSITKAKLDSNLRGTVDDVSNLKNEINEFSGVAKADSQVVTDQYGNAVAHKYFSNKYSDVSPNLFDRSNVLTGVDLDGNAKSGYASMNYYLPIYPGIKYCISNVTTYQQYGYDENKDRISTNVGLSTTAQVLNSSIKFIRVCLAWNSNNQKNFGIYAGIDEHSIKMSYGDPVPYHDEDGEYERYQKRKGLLADKTQLLPNDGGRYSGTDEINKYTKFVHGTNHSLLINNATPGDQWYERGVRQYFSATTIDLTRDSGVRGFLPSTIGASVGDTVYIGFLAKSNTGGFVSNVVETDGFAESGQWVLFGNDIRNYEFSYAVTSENVETAITFKIAANIQFSNIYARKASNAKYEHLFTDPARYSVQKDYVTAALKTKKLVAFGDSVTNQGYFLDSLQELLPLGSLINEGIGGSCFCYSNTSTGSNFYNIVETEQEDIEEADIVTVAYGTNDSNYIGKTTTIGSILPAGSTFDLLTVYGAIQTGLEKIISYNSSARIVMIIPATWIEYGYREQIAKAITDCAELYGCIVADFRRCGCNALTQAEMTSDSLHPTRETGKLCGKILADALIPIYMKFDSLSVINSINGTGGIPAPVSPSNGQFLMFNGTAWVAQALPTYNGGVL